MYGKELIIDLYRCDVSKFNRKSIKAWLDGLCKLIDMKQEDLHFWDYKGVPKAEIPKEVHLVGTSAVQFITTSNIVIHTLDLIEEAYINIFSCKSFDDLAAKEFTAKWFGSTKSQWHSITRGRRSEA